MTFCRSGSRCRCRALTLTWTCNQKALSARNWPNESCSIRNRWVTKYCKSSNSFCFSRLQPNAIEVESGYSWITASLSKGTWGHGENADRLNVEHVLLGKPDSGFASTALPTDRRGPRPPVATVCKAVCGAFRHFTETRGPRLAPSPCNCTNFYSLDCWEQGFKAFRCFKTHQGLTEATKNLKLVRRLVGSRQPIESGRCRIGVACRGAETSHRGSSSIFWKSLETGRNNTFQFVWLGGL